MQNRETCLDANAQPIKTAAGQAELSTRARRISQRHRTVLFLVDGKRSAAQVRAMAVQAGVPVHCYDELVALGLIGLAPMAGAAAADPRATLAAVPPMPPPVPESINAELESLLPASRTLSPESIAADSRFDVRSNDDVWRLARAAGAPEDAALAQARAILQREVRSAAPVAGSLTWLRLRRAGTRHELLELLGEVHACIAKPHRALATAQVLSRVRHLLERRVDAPSPA